MSDFQMKRFFKNECVIHPDSYYVVYDATYNKMYIIAHLWNFRIFRMNIKNNV